uniref:Charged multivesicular body protein 4b n=1 Tax=Ditylenchus dipsaci TaxID=166011 RepID=A0A915CLU0_9BILA
MYKFVVLCTLIFLLTAPQISFADVDGVLNGYGIKKNQEMLSGLQSQVAQNADMLQRILERGRPDPQAAIEKLADVEELLLKKQVNLEEKIKTELATAKKHGTKNKRMALQALRRKKNHEKELDHVDGVLNTITQQKNALENATMNADVMQVMSSSSKALKNAHGNMSVEKIESMMDEVSEGLEEADAVRDAFASANDYDVDELEQELEQLQREEEDQQMVKHKFPVTPVSNPTRKVEESYTDEEEKELQKLASWST